MGVARAWGFEILDVGLVGFTKACWVSGNFLKVSRVEGVGMQVCRFVSKLKVSGLGFRAGDSGCKTCIIDLHSTK